MGSAEACKYYKTPAICHGMLEIFKHVTTILQNLWGFEIFHDFVE